MPFMHSEKLSDHEFSLPFFKKYPDSSIDNYIIKNLDIEITLIVGKQSTKLKKQNYENVKKQYYS